jgi:hypothetical protein
VKGGKKPTWFNNTDKQLAAIALRCQQIDNKLDLLTIQIGRNQMATKATLDDLQAQVTQTTTVEASAVTLIQGIAAALQAALAANDPAKVQAIVDQLSTSASALAAAVTANTPPAP